MVICHRHWRTAMLFALLVISACSTLIGAKPPTVVVADPKEDYIYVRLLFGAGSAYDPPGKEGLAYFTASVVVPHLGYYGDNGPDSTERALFDQRAHFEATVDRDVVVISGGCPPRLWHEFSRILISRLTAPVFDTLAGEQPARRHVGSLGQTGPDDLALAPAAMQYYLYRDHPYGHPPEGFEHTIRTLTMADAREFWRTHYTNGNYMLGLAGDVPLSAADDIHAALRSLPAGGKPRMPPLPNPSHSGLSVYIIEKPDCVWPVLYVGRPFDAVRGDSVFLSLELAAACLANYDGARLDRLLRTDRRLVLGAIAFVGHSSPDSESGLSDPFLPRRQEYFMAGTMTKPVNAAFVLNIIMHELDDLSERGLAQAELDSARAYLSRWGSLAERRWCEDRMKTCLRDLWLGVEGTSEKHRDDAARLTTAGVRRAIAPLLNPRTMTVIAVVPDGQAFATQLLGGPLTCEYPDSIDQRRMRAEDQRFLSYRPPWEVQKMRIVKAAEMFR